MMIELKYRLVGSPTTYTRVFDAVLMRPEPTVSRIAFRSLREIEGRHTLSTRSNYDVLISADELISSGARDFIKAFLVTSVRWWIKWQNDDASWSEFVEVVHEKDGAWPVSFIDDVDALMETRFKLIAKNPD